MLQVNSGRCVVVSFWDIKRMRKKTDKISVWHRIWQIFFAVFKHLPNLVSKGGPVYYREVIEDLGGGIIKLAQILAIRYEILPERYCRELANLFDRVPPMSREKIVGIFQEEFGRKPEEVFQRFAYAPHATASFGQVHRAMLGGRQLAVKIQRPDAYAKSQADIFILKLLVKFAEIFLQAPVSLKDAIREWQNWTLAELDYVKEVRNAERLKELAVDLGDQIYIPKVFKELSTKRILVLEFLEGENLNELIYREKNLLSVADRERIAKQVVWVQLLYYFKGGFFHADPHPGNIILLRDGRLGFVDFGIMGEAGTMLQNFHFANFIRFSAEGMISRAVSHFKEVMRDKLLPEEVVGDLQYGWRDKTAEELKFGIIKFLESKMGAVIIKWGHKVGDTKESLAERSSARHFLDLVAMGRRYGLELPMNLLAFVRAVVITDMVCLVLNPNFDMKQEMRLFFRENADIVAKPLAEPEVIGVVKTGVVEMSEMERELTFEKKKVLLERYLEHAAHILERMVEEDPKGTTYFVTN